MPRSEQGREFERWCIQLMRVLDWRVAHFRPALTKHGWRTAVSADGQGYPDFVAVKGKRIIAAEVKSGAGRLTPDQVTWLRVLGQAGVEVYVWRDNDRQLVADVLQGKPVSQWEPPTPKVKVKAEPLFRPTPGV